MASVRLLLALLSFGLFASAAQGGPIVYQLDPIASTASLTATLSDVGGGAPIPLGAASIDVTGTFVEFDSGAPSLVDLEIVGQSVQPIVLSQPVTDGAGNLVQSVSIDPFRLVAAGAFTTVQLVPGLFWASGLVEVSSLTLNGVLPPFTSTLTASPITITGSSPTFETSGFTLASFDVYNASGDFIEDGLQIKLDLTLVAEPMPEPESAVMMMIALGLVGHGVNRVRRPRQPQC